MHGLFYVFDGKVHISGLAIQFNLASLSRASRVTLREIHNQLSMIHCVMFHFNLYTDLSHAPEQYAIEHPGFDNYSLNQITGRRSLRLPPRPTLGKMPAQTIIRSDEVHQEPQAGAIASELSSLSRRAQQAVQNFHQILATRQLVRLPRPNTAPAADSLSGQMDDEHGESSAAQLMRQTSRLLQAKNQMERVSLLSGLYSLA
ncbi:unnamed protein product [Dibothriocephalus latus]|uniref:Uncharacterized protein n=1 Tax=Dibothriocephalus latus TaxID=60516 RepID=A0A3P7LV59_DIBLA|nr:unnamed protein product [Dibothriocephalus latus]